MSIWSDTFKHVEHRPYPLPDCAWTMHMSWQELLFAHWPFAPEIIRERITATFGGVPAGLEIDTFEGSCYLGIVPFRMARTGLRFWPTLLGPHTFPELNVRTYVRYKDRPGVLFFSLDAASRLAVFTARRWFYLPYFNARMALASADRNSSVGATLGSPRMPTLETGEGIHYRSTRAHGGAPEAAFEASYGPTGAVYNSQPGTLERWLTERYCLYSIGPRQSLWRGEIHHELWPLQSAQAEISLNTMAACHGVALPDVKPILHYVKNIDVVAWAPERV